MKELYLYDCDDLAFEMTEKYDEIKRDEGCADVSAIAKYEEARQLIASLAGFGFGINSIEIADEEWDGYADEFIVSVLSDEIWCEKAKDENRYFYVESDVVYLLDNCSSKIIPKIESKVSYEVHLGEEDEEEDDEWFSLKEDDDEDDEWFSLEEDDDEDDEWFSLEEDCDHCTVKGCKKRPENRKVSKSSKEHEKPAIKTQNEIIRDDDGNLHGFTASMADEHGYRSQSFYTTDNLEEKAIRSLMRFWGI